MAASIEYPIEHPSEFEFLVAKTGPTQEPGWLPLWAHLQDTRGIMERLLSHWVPEHVKQQFAAHISPQHWMQVCTFAALVHDIGKATPLFQSKITVHLTEAQAKLQRLGLEFPSPSDFLDAGKTPHGLAGEAILLHLDCPAGIAAVVGAHHGKPVGIASDPLDAMWDYEENFYGLQGEGSDAGLHWEEVWQAWLTAALHQCGYTDVSQLPHLDIPSQVLLSGLLIMADWIASNTTYFPLLDLDNTGRSLSYPHRVQEAWSRLSLPDQWEPSLLSMDRDTFHLRFGFDFNSVQQCVLQAVEHSRQPGIYILEAQMGVGKTEAALGAAELLASRLGCGGIFFGLPTQATSNGIFPRLKQWAQQQSQQAQHGIRLAHGMAQLNEAYTALFQGHAIQNEDDAATGLVVHSWFEGRKQALLADFVIGTVDQLLMAALKQKHIMLRHLGLDGKVVIIDECHAYDTYMNRYLDRALNWLGTYGVPVILLSATLPAQRRTQLIQAYQNQDAALQSNLSWQTNQAYPLLTWTDGPGVHQCAIPVDGPSRCVEIRNGTVQMLREILTPAMTHGGCVGVLVNTVGQAQALAQQLRTSFPNNRVILIHSRLLMADRTRREAELLTLLGKTSTPSQRQGLIVVGTQILEQSLDIDFDFMVTQLCPMDLLLQRLGRLHRHNRVRPEGLETPECVILDRDAPDDGTRYIYGDWLLRRTAQLLPQQISLPQDISPLVQETYRAGGEFLSPTDQLWSLWAEHQAASAKQWQKASQYCIPPVAYLEETMHGLLDSGVGDQEWAAQATVRDGEPSLDVLVLMLQGDEAVSFVPWQHDGAALPCHRAPSLQECRQILTQRLQLPRVLCGRNLDHTIVQLEQLRQAVVPQWQHAPLLDGELFLFLNTQGTAVLSGYQLNYTEELGLSWKREER